MVQDGNIRYHRRCAGARHQAAIETTCRRPPNWS